MSKKVSFKEEQNKSVLNDPKAVEFLKQFNLKRVVEGRGHDGGGLVCDLYLRSVKIAEYLDDGWGGMPNIYYEKGREAQLTEMLNEINFGQIMFDNGWAFMDSVEKINIQTQIEHVVEMCNQLRFLAKLEKRCKGRLIYGTDYYTQETYWKGVKDLKVIPKAQLQTVYNGIKAKLEPHQRFFNSDEQLKSLGIVL